MARKTPRAQRRAGRAVRAGGFALAATLALGQATSAQTMSANSAAFNAGFGRIAGEENHPVNVSLTDGAGNTTLIGGLIQPTAGSLFAEVPGAVGGAALAGGATSTTTAGGASGAQDSFSGAGGGSSASAIGNSLNVIVQGDNNTVIVNATQTNNGAVTATSTTSGK